MRLGIKWRPPFADWGRMRFGTRLARAKWQERGSPLQSRQGNNSPRGGFGLLNQQMEDDMVTMVGNESDIKGLVKDLIYLEYDAIAAYDSCIERLDDKQFATKITSFKQDHLQHLEVLNEMARELGIQAPTRGDMKEMLTTGKIALADLMGDAAILKAMKTNEDDTVTAYERASRHEDAIPASKAFFMKAHQDEERHRAWMDTTAKAL
nr:DUF2383 domain-containing protein [Rhizobium leguminosarum]